MKAEIERGVPDERKRQGPKRAQVLRTVYVRTVYVRTVYVRRVVEPEGVIKFLTVRDLMSPGAESLFGNYEGCCGEGFWLWPRRRGRSIPAAGCDDRPNAGHGQKTRRPEGFRGKGRLASLLLGYGQLAGMLPPRAIRPFARKQALCE